MNTKYIGKFLVFIIFQFIFCLNISGQKNNKKNILPKPKPLKDTTILSFIKVNDSLSYMYFKDSMIIWKIKQKYVWWKRIKETEKLLINSHTTLWQLKKKQLIWWKFNDSIQIIGENNVKFNLSCFSLNDSTKFWKLSDSLRFFQFKKTESIWSETSSIQNFNPLKTFEFQANDSTKIWIPNDTFWVISTRDTLKLWHINRSIKQWKISENTKGWTLAPTIEIWKIKSDLQLLTINKNEFDWTESNFKSDWKINTTTKILNVNKNYYLKKENDSIQFWSPYRNLIIRISDTLCLWETQILQSSIKKKKDTVEIFPYIVDSIPLKKIDKKVNFWILNDSVQVWKQNETHELWEKANQTTLWKVSDSVYIWTIDAKKRVSLYLDSIRCWQYADTLHDWIENTVINDWKPNDSIRIVTVFENIKLYIKTGLPPGQLWRINPHLRKTALSQKTTSQIQINDSSYVWIVNDSTFIQIEYPSFKYGKWKLDKRKKAWTKIKPKFENIWRENEHATYWKLTDSTVFWQLTPEFRIFKIQNQVKFWRKSLKTNIWYFDSSYVSIPYNDTLDCWNMGDSVMVWKFNNRLKIWKIDRESKIYRVGDSIKFFTYQPASTPVLKKKVSNWKTSGMGNINFSQGYFSHWAAGGDNNVAISTILKYAANYEKKDFRWDNDFQMEYGTLQRENSTFKTNLDKTEITTKFGQKAYRNFFYSIFAGFKSQLFRNYDKYPKDTILISKLLSPYTVVYGAGIDYKPNQKMSIVISPLSSKITKFRDSTEIDKTKHGLKKEDIDKKEFGAYIKTKNTIDLSTNIQIENKIDFFTDYQDNFKEIDINWEVAIAMKVNKYINTNINTHLIYDDDINAPIYDKDKKLIGSGPRIQFKEILNIGFSYIF